MIPACDPSERLSADDMATLREEQFTAAALSAARAGSADLKPTGRCYNCDERLAPGLLYCDADCRDDHGVRLAAARREGRRA